MSKKLNVVVKKVNDEFGKIVEVEDTLKSWQGIVDGCIETYPLTDNILIVLNEEGKLKGLEPNIGIPCLDDQVEVIVGDIAFVSHDGMGEFTSLSEDDMDFLTKVGIL